MNIRHLTVFSALALASVSTSGVHASPAAATIRPEWRAVNNDLWTALEGTASISDADIVSAFTHALDKRISYAAACRSTVDPRVLNEYAEFIWRMALKSGLARSMDPGRIEALEAMLAKLNTMPEIENKARIRDYLTIALAYSRHDVPEEIMLKYLDTSSESVGMTDVVVTAMIRSKSPDPRPSEVASDDGRPFLCN